MQDLYFYKVCWLVDIFIKKYFKKWRNFFNNWFHYLDINKISPIDYCLTDLLNYEFDQYYNWYQ